MPIHRGVDIGICGFRRRLEQCCGLHDLSALAESALRHVDVAPRHLQWMFASWMQRFNGCDSGAIERVHFALTGTNGCVRNVHCASAALVDTATVFRAGQGEIVAQEPEQRHGWIAAEGVARAVDGEGDCGGGYWHARRREGRMDVLMWERMGERATSNFDLNGRDD